MIVLIRLIVLKSNCSKLKPNLRGIQNEHRKQGIPASNR